jgi:hypothetical protein
LKILKVVNVAVNEKLIPDYFNEKAANSGGFMWNIETDY